MATASFTKDIMSQTMDIKLSKGASKTESISTLCTDIFLIVIKMRDAEDLGETSALRKLILYYLQQFEKNCSVMGISSETIGAVKYALVAILDETVLSIPSQARDYWISNPLQLDIFGDNIAGQEFYNKLHNFMKDPDNNRDALEVFYLCLSLGFEGKYKVGNAEQREEVITSLARMLVKSGSNQIDTLSPHAIRMSIMKKTQGVQKVNLVPLWAIGSSLAAMLLLTWIIMRAVSGSHVQSIVDAVIR